MSHAFFVKGALTVAGAMLVAICLLFAGPAPEASAKGKKLHACVVKQGPDKGVMHFSRKGKCPKGEKRVSWNKKGKRGKQGAAGATGERGPQGPSGVTDELLNTIAQQQTKIDELTSQVNTLTTQLGTVTSQLNGLSPQVAALCTQMGTVTGRANALGAVIAGITLSGIIPAGLGLTIPALPAALGSFSCPS